MKKYTSEIKRSGREVPKRKPRKNGVKLFNKAGIEIIGEREQRRKFINGEEVN